MNLEDTDEHDAPPPPGRQVLPFAGNSSQVKSVRLHPRRGQQLARSRGWTVSVHKNLFLRNCVEGRERKLLGAAKKVGRLCVHVRILSACLLFCQRISRSRQKPRFS
jgi:hypothetical protein